MPATPVPRSTGTRNSPRSNSFRPPIQPGQAPQNPHGEPTALRRRDLSPWHLERSTRRHRHYPFCRFPAHADPRFPFRCRSRLRRRAFLTITDSDTIPSRAARDSNRFSDTGTRALINAENRVCDVIISCAVVSHARKHCQQLFFALAKCCRLCHNAPMSKRSVVVARVTAAMKSALEERARQRGESEAVLVREALKTYLVTTSGELHETPVLYTNKTTPRK